MPLDYVREERDTKTALCAVLVEAPGLEPGSEKQVIQASTSVVYDLFLALQSPIDGIHPRQLVFGVP